MILIARKAILFILLLCSLRFFNEAETAVTSLSGACLRRSKSKGKSDKILQKRNFLGTAYAGTDDCHDS